MFTPFHHDGHDTGFQRAFVCDLWPSPGSAHSWAKAELMDMPINSRPKGENMDRSKGSGQGQKNKVTNGNYVL